MARLTVFSSLALAERAFPRGIEDELPERRPRLVSARAAERLALLTRAAKPARPFDEEPDLALTLANATFLTRAGELRRVLLRIKWVSSSDSFTEGDGDDEGVAFRLPFRCVI